MPGSVLETRKKVWDKTCKNSFSQENLVAKCLTAGHVIFYMAFLEVGSFNTMTIDKIRDLDFGMVALKHSF